MYLSLSFILFSFDPSLLFCSKDHSARKV
jgi:hypothetical protein